MWRRMTQIDWSSWHPPGDCLRPWQPRIVCTGGGSLVLARVVDCGKCGSMAARRKARHRRDAGVRDAADRREPLALYAPRGDHAAPPMAWRSSSRRSSGFDNRAEVRASNPLGRIPALVLDSGEVLINSAAIIDHLDEAYGRERALTPAAGAERRAVLRVAALMMGACDKLLQPPTSATASRPRRCTSRGSTIASRRRPMRSWRSTRWRSRARAICCSGV